MTAAGTALIVGEWLRRGALAGQSVTLHLSALADGVSRARAAARYVVEVSGSWDEPAGRVMLCDRAGYPLLLDLAGVGRWLVRYLPGEACAVTLVLDDAAELPAVWTAGRVAGQAARVAALDPAAIEAGAAQKRATVTDWADGPRRAAVLAAADRMDAAAALLRVLKAG